MKIISRDEALTQARIILERAESERIAVDKEHLMDDTELAYDMCRKLNSARELIECLDRLLVCYRIGTRPTDKLMEDIPRLRKEVGTREIIE
jgi:hypothetical protein